MAVTLCFDFGNTRLKCAVFADRELQEVIVLENGEPETVAALADRHSASYSILSSVIHHDIAVEEVLRTKTKFHKLDHHSKIPVTTPVGKPETIGADRLALVVGIDTLFPGRHNLAIGLGSAITYNFINKNKEFMGGGISPGMEMRFKSLHTFTAKLPLIKADWNFPLVGYDTRTNILSGVIFGMAREIDGMIELYEEKYSNFNVVLCGGDAVFFADFLKKKTFVEPDLLYKGLFSIAQYNLQ
jgi:type III pantothenate kinase